MCALNLQIKLMQSEDSHKLSMSEEERNFGYSVGLVSTLACGDAINS